MCAKFWFRTLARIAHHSRARMPPRREWRKNTNEDLDSGRGTECPGAVIVVEGAERGGDQLCRVLDNDRQSHSAARARQAWDCGEQSGRLAPLPAPPNIHTR